MLRKLIEKEEMNAIYCVSASGGKTLVAELLALREIKLNKRDVLFVFPFISLAKESAKTLSLFAEKLGFEIEEFAGENGILPTVKRKPEKKYLYIATYEKAYLLFTHLHENKRLDELGLVMIDEVHMLGDGSRRGCTLEAFLLMCVLAKRKELFNARLLALSATLDNLEQLAKFLDNAHVMRRDHRPIKLEEFVQDTGGDGKIVIKRYVDKTLVPAEIGEANVPKKPEEVLEEDPDNLVGLFKHVLGEREPPKPALIFCATKENCENVIKLLCKHLPKEPYQSYKKQERSDLLSKLRNLNNGQKCDEALERGVPYGFAYHNTNLTNEEREIVENGFRSGTLCVLACTSTLAAGVNLPAASVIIRAPSVSNQLITVSQYRQMIGRAGRTGLCKQQVAQSFLILPKNCKEVEKAKARKLLFEKPDLQCLSSINKHPEGISHIVLNLLYLSLSNSNNSKEQLLDLLRTQTLFGIQFGDSTGFESNFNSVFDNLLQLKLVQMQPGQEGVISITKLGRAVVKSLVEIGRCSDLCTNLRKFNEFAQRFNGLINTYSCLICSLAFVDNELQSYSLNNQDFYKIFSGANSFFQTMSETLFGINHAKAAEINQQAKFHENACRIRLAIIAYEFFYDNFESKLSFVAKLKSAKF